MFVRNVLYRGETPRYPRVLAAASPIGRRRLGYDANLQACET